MLTRDYVMRMVKQLAGALGRIMGLRKAGRLEEALVALGETERDVLAHAADLVGKVDPETAARLLGSKESALMYAEILAERADIQEAQGHGESASRGRTRSLQVCLEARGMGTASDAKLREVVARVRPHVDTQALPPRYAALLAALD
jgi:hypothetical protein